MKRMFSLLLSVLLIATMFFCVTPVASAAVDKLRVQVNEPVMDGKVSFSASVGSAYYNIKTDVNNSHYTNGVNWYDVTDSKYPDNEDTFELFHVYKVTVAVVCETGYEFSSSVTAELNGNAASVEIVSEGDGRHSTKVAYISYTFPSLHRPTISTEATSVALTGVNIPAVGDIPDYNVTTDRNCKVVLTYSVGNYMNGILWYDMTDGKALTVQDKFAGGRQYRISVMIAPDNNQYFTSNLTATLNGQQASVATLDNGNAIVSYVFPATNPTVSTVHVTNIYEPMAGQHPVFDAIVEESGTCEICTSLDGNRWTNGVQWYDETNKRLMTEDDTFVAGQQYTVEVLVSTIAPATYEKIYIGYINGVYGSCDVQTTGEYANRLMAVRRTITAGYLLGDSDGNGVVNIKDATVIQRHLADIKNTTYIELASDTNEDGRISIQDATAVQRYLADLPTNIRIGTVIK